jgi:hypothetical protein
MRKEMGEWEEMKRNVPIYRFFGWILLVEAKLQLLVVVKLHLVQNSTT